MKEYAVFKYLPQHDLWERLSVWLEKDQAEDFKRLATSTYKGSRLVLFRSEGEGLT